LNAQNLKLSEFRLIIPALALCVSEKLGFYDPGERLRFGLQHALLMCGEAIPIRVFCGSVLSNIEN
jgi:hypothetical protein